MPLIQDLIKKMKGEEEPDEEPREIRDRYLESLRRERQVQMNEVEKIELKGKIVEFKKNNLREHMFGIKDKREREQNILGQMKKVKILEGTNILKEKSIMKQKSIIGKDSLLNNRKKEFKEVKILALSKNYP